VVDTPVGKKGTGRRPKAGCTEGGMTVNLRQAARFDLFSRFGLFGGLSADKLAAFVR